MLGMLHACRIHDDILQPLLPPDTPVGPARAGRPPCTQWRRAAGDLVCFVDQARSLARYSSCHGVLGTNLRTGGCNGGKENGVWEALHMKLLALLNAVTASWTWMSSSLTATMVPAPGGGGDTGPNPTDRAKSGTKHTLLVGQQRRALLALHTTGANASDQQQLETIIHKFPHIQGKPGRPKEHPRGRLWRDRRL